jgi:tRNA (mo5U34)-methyltransferase
VLEYAPWWHQIDLGHGVRTREVAPQHPESFDVNYPSNLMRHIEPILPKSMQDMSVLGVGCAEGFFSIECARRGAKKVMSIEILQTDQCFDLGLMLGVLYHLDNPVLGLQRMASVTDELIIETTVIPHTEKSIMIWGKSQGLDDGWIPSLSCVEDMLRHGGFTAINRLPRSGSKRVTLHCRKGLVS